PTNLSNTYLFFFQAEDGIRDRNVTGVQTCALPIWTVDTPETELDATDFAAFRPLADLPMAMTAHVVFSAIDAAHPATTSATMIRSEERRVGKECRYRR